MANVQVIGRENHLLWRKICPSLHAVAKNWRNCSLSKNYQNSSGKGGRRAPSKNFNFSKNCTKFEKSQFLLN